MTQEIFCIICLFEGSRYLLNDASCSLGNFPPVPPSEIPVKLVLAPNLQFWGVEWGGAEREREIEKQTQYRNVLSVPVRMVELMTKIR